MLQIILFVLQICTKYDRMQIERGEWIMATGARIRERRDQLNMSAQQLADKVGIAKTTIIRYEKGEIEKIPYLNFLKILIALETTPKDLLSEEEYELVVKTDELRGFYNALGNAQKEMMEKLTKLSPGDVKIVDAVAQGLIAQHKE